MTGKIRKIRIPQKMRNLELVLLLLAFTINASAITLVQFGALGGFGHVGL